MSIENHEISSKILENVIFINRIKIPSYIYIFGACHEWREVIIRQIPEEATTLQAANLELGMTVWF